MVRHVWTGISVVEGAGGITERRLTHSDKISAKNHDEGTPRSGGSFRTPDASVEPEDEVLYLHRQERHLHH